MSKGISKKEIINNIFKNKVSRAVLTLTFLTVIILIELPNRVVLPSFYDEMIENILDEAKRVGKHIARHQNASERVTVIQTAIDKLKDDFKVAKIKLFDKEGYIIFSTDRKDIGNKNKYDYFYNRVAKGEMVYKIANKGKTTLDDKIIQKDVAEIYVPIFKDDEFTGASEIYYDITQKRESLNLLIKRVQNIYFSISIVLAVFVFFMLYIVSRADLRSKSMEFQLHQKSKLASMGEMIGNIAHQWRQPLSSISMAASAIKLQKEMGILDDKTIDDFTDKIMGSTQYLSSTIEDFRNFFKQEKEAKVLKGDKLIDSTLSLISGNIKKAEIEIIKEIEDVDISTYENDLKQVLLNIINNAKDKLLECEDQDRYIFINVKMISNFISISIKDNAGGVPEDIINKIFDPYFTTKHQSQGTGIGLFMTLQIIEKHLGGTIDVTNETYLYQNHKYIGARFTILLPTM